MKRIVFLVMLISTAMGLYGAFGALSPSGIVIEAQGSGYRLLRDREPLFIKGVHGTERLNELRAAGGNCVVAPDLIEAEEVLDRAADAGITVAVSIQLRQENGMSYTHAHSVAEAIHELRPAIRKIGNHPALLLWIIQSDIADTQQTNSIAYRAVNALAKVLLHEAPEHPVVADIGILDPTSPKPQMLAMYCPEVDVLGWTPTSDHTNTVKHIIESGWEKPYILMRLAAPAPDPQHSTPWLSPIEPTASDKAAWMLGLYHTLVISSQGLCLGSFAYSWDPLSVITPTWYTLFFKDGHRAELVDALTFAWTGALPQNRAPHILSVTSAIHARLAPPGSAQTAAVTATDPESDPLTYEWVLVREIDEGDTVRQLPLRYETIIDSIERPNRPQVDFTVPRDGGAYRLIIFVRDDKGGATSANIPFLVETVRTPISTGDYASETRKAVESQEDESGSHVEIRYTLDGGWMLYVNGETFFVKGAGGQRNLAGIKAAGGNAIRTWSTDFAGKVLDEAHEHGLMVCLGLWMQQERHRFNYADEVAVERQLRKLRAAVKRHKNHPALLMWCVGNEVEWGEGTNVAVYRAMNQVARMVREEDPHHPTTTAFADIGKNSVKAALAARYCPDIDILGINSYGGLSSMADRLRDVGWIRPYMIMEFGPKGQWEVETTDWGAEIEQMPLEKASFYLQSYLKSISASENWCVGSFVFSWDYKFECTPTWYSMHLADGTKMNTVDTMWSAWSQRPPPNRSPQITGIESPLKHVAVAPNQHIEISVTAVDPDGDPLRYEWILMSEHKSKDRHGVVHTELKTVPGRIKDPSAAVTHIHTPGARGAYRVFCYVYDGQGGAGSANMPFLVDGR